MNTLLYKNTISEYFKTQPVLKAFLFGSVLNEQFSDKSDIDILVELDYQQGGSGFFTFLQMQEDLSILTHRKVDLVSANGISNLIKPLIDSSKELMYERKG